MKKLPHLFEANRRWADSITRQDPDFFKRLSDQQKPRYLWIGCSDSRVPANQIVALSPGEIFVHRNVANVVVHSDLNCLSVIQFAVEVLGVTDIIVCGHYRCGGVMASLEGTRHGLVDNWLGHVRDVARRHDERLRTIADPAAQGDCLCELNVIEQAANACRVSAVCDRWDAGQPLNIHGWIYDIGDGLLRDLGFCVDGSEVLAAEYERALSGRAGG